MAAAAFAFELSRCYCIILTIKMSLYLILKGLSCYSRLNPKKPLKSRVCARRLSAHKQEKQTATIRKRSIYFVAPVSTADKRDGHRFPDSKIRNNGWSFGGYWNSKGGRSKFIRTDKF